MYYPAEIIKEISGLQEYNLYSFFFYLIGEAKKKKKKKK